MGGIVLRIHKVRPLNNEGKKKVLSNVVIARDGFEEGMLTLEDRAMAELTTVEEEFFSKQHHPISLETPTGLESLDLP